MFVVYKGTSRTVLALEINLPSLQFQASYCHFAQNERSFIALFAGAVSIKSLIIPEYIFF